MPKANCIFKQNNSFDNEIYILVMSKHPFVKTIVRPDTRRMLIF